MAKIIGKYPNSDEFSVLMKRGGRCHMIVMYSFFGGDVEEYVATFDGVHDMTHIVDEEALRQQIYDYVKECERDPY